jgi:hypothetical protein
MPHLPELGLVHLVPRHLVPALQAQVLLLELPQKPVLRLPSILPVTEAIFPTMLDLHSR